MSVYAFLAKLVLQEVRTPKSEILGTHDTCAKRFQLSFTVFFLAKRPRNRPLKFRFLLHDRRALTLMLEGNTKLGWLGPAANFGPLNSPDPGVLDPQLSDILSFLSFQSIKLVFPSKSVSFLGMLRPGQCGSPSLNRIVGMYQIQKNVFLLCISLLLYDFPLKPPKSYW